MQQNFTFNLHQSLGTLNKTTEAT